MRDEGREGQEAGREGKTIGYGVRNGQSLLKI